MTDRRPDDDDHAWLLARERGQPGPAIDDARARRYAQLGSQIADLPAVPAGTVQRAGWEQAVLAAIDGKDAPAVSEPPPKKHRRTVAAAAAFAVVACAAIVVLVRRPGAPPDGTEVTRGIHIEPGRLGVEHAVQVRRADIAVPHELRDGDRVTTGDRIRASVRTSIDAYVYLAFCAGGRLQIYPSLRGLRTRAGELTLVPEGGAELVVDDQPGAEVLYLIVSRDELATADPALAALVAASDGKAVDCGPSLDPGLMRPDASGISVARYRFVH